MVGFTAGAVVERVYYAVPDSVGAAGREFDTADEAIAHARGRWLLRNIDRTPPVVEERWLVRDVGGAAVDLAVTRTPIGAEH